MSGRTARRGREGSRWYNERPSAKDFAAWFQTVPLHEGLKHDDFIGGVTLIQQKEKVDEVVGYRDDGTAVIQERTHLVYIPHPQVMARVAYFEALRKLHTDDWVTVIEPQEASGDKVGLPAGFFRLAIQTQPPVSFVGCSLRVRIFEAGSVYWADVSEGPQRALTCRRVLEGVPIMEGPAGTKVVPVINRWGKPDENALMKAETGALGRALGAAGMLVIPGAGVATAEDVQEAIAEPTLPAQAPLVTNVTYAGPATSTNVASTFTGGVVAADLWDQAAKLVAQLGELSQPELRAFNEWCQERKITLADANDAQIKTVVKKLEQTIDRLAP